MPNFAHDRKLSLQKKQGKDEPTKSIHSILLQVMVVRVPEHGSRAVEMEEMEEGMESPLDVLSRAATMVEAVNTSSARTPGRVEDISSSSTPGRVLETSTTSTPGREDTENSPPSQVLQFSFLKTKGLMT